MGKREELDAFLLRADEFIDSKFILADVKIVNLLKTIATSDTLLAIFKNCLSGFDYVEAQKKYLVKSRYLSEEKGEFIIPPNSRELLAFVFNLLVDMDAKKIDLSEFIRKYFYEDGSLSAAYSAFITSMIKPFRNSVGTLMESVIDGRLQDPVEALTEEEERKKREEDAEEARIKQEKELSQKTYGESLKKLRSILVADKLNIKNCKLSDNVKEELRLSVDMLANVIEGEDKDALNYAYLAYKYCAKAHPILFFNRVKVTGKLIKDVINEL